MFDRSSKIYKENINAKLTMREYAIYAIKTFH